MTKCGAKPRVRSRKRYEYFEKKTIFRLVRVLSVNMWRVKEKGNEARKTLEEHDREGPRGMERLYMDCQK